MESQNQILEVWGDLACFSRPEMKVERFSYPVITPSAARGIFDAIFCKPNKDPTQAQFRWQITQIEVLTPVSYLALRRNEVQAKISTRKVQQWLKDPQQEVEPILADNTAKGKEVRTQRQTMALRNVHYRLHAQIHPWPGHEQKLAGFEAQFQRRASQGKCIHQPYFGCREFPAYFQLADDNGPAPVPWSQNLGLMLYDVFDLARPGTCTSAAQVSLFRAQVAEGVLTVPPYESEKVLKPEGGRV